MGGFLSVLTGGLIGGKDPEPQQLPDIRRAEEEKTAIDPNRGAGSKVAKQRALIAARKKGRNQFRIDLAEPTSVGTGVSIPGRSSDGR